MEPDPRLLSLTRPLDQVALGLALLPDPMHLKSRFIFFFIFEKKILLTCCEAQTNMLVLSMCIAWPPKASSLHLGHDHTTTYLP